MYHFPGSYFILYSNETNIQAIKKSTQERNEGNLKNDMKDDMKAVLRVISIQRAQKQTARWYFDQDGRDSWEMDRLWGFL